MAPIYGLLLAVKGEIKRIKLADGPSTLDQEALQRIIKKKTPLKELGNYVYAGHKITLFGWTSGKAGTENKHDLPPPLHESVVYSDILLISSKDMHEWTNPVNFTPDQYEKFYTKAMGGDDDDDDEDENSDEDTEEEQEEADEEIVKMSKKKQAAAEDGEPEDEGDDAESTSDDDEEEEGEDDEEVLAALEDDEETAVAPVTKRAAASKKKAAAAKTNLTTVQNTGRAAQQKLLARPGFVEISEVSVVPKEECPERTIRCHVLTLIKSKVGTFLNAKDQVRLEAVILDAALQDAEKKFVVKHFDNALFKVCYMNSARRLLSNLDPSSYVHNTHLLPRLRNGDLDISHLATMNNMDYAPALYSQLHERQLLREQRQLEGNKAMATDQFMCGRCGKRETTFYELQTRSADEPMTKFITCLNCNNHWRK
jgi:DNA-directed RNA polymerase subunit M/transcription elongation factor TFIIS